VSKFEDFLGELKGEIKDLVAEHWGNFASAATKDASAFVDESVEDLKRWTQLLSDGSITVHEFEFLLQAKKDLLEMTALKEAGLAQVQRDRFVSGLITTIISVAVKAFV
jgi:hypothetical protein